MMTSSKHDEVVLATEDLCKCFGKTRAVDHLNIEVSRGDIFGFLGPNGAGKSTTIRMMLALLKPTNGAVSIFGEELRRNRLRLLGRIGALVETPAFYPYLTGYQNLCTFAKSGGFLNQSRIRELLDLVGLKDRAEDKVKAYSQGMRERLGIAQALLSAPELIILDEPMNGLDPAGFAEMRLLIKDLSEREGVTFFISSHLLHEVQQMCNRVAIINEGKMIVQKDVSELLAGDSGRVRVSLSDAQDKAIALIKRQFWCEGAVATEDGSIEITLPPDRIAELNRLLVTSGFDVTEIVRRQMTLEDMFLHLTRS